MPCCGQTKINNASTPVIIGEDEGVSVLAVASINIAGLKPNRETWVRGSHVQTMVDAGWLRLV